MKNAAKLPRKETRATRPFGNGVPRKSMVVPRAPVDYHGDARDYYRQFDERNDSRLTEEIKLFCPFESAVNPHVEDAQGASVEWASRLGMVRSKEHRDKLNRSKVAWLPARGFPSAPRDVLQLAADWTTLFCLLDDLIEVRVADPLDVSTYFLQLNDVFANGRIKSDSDPIASGLMDLRQRLARLTSKTLCKRFMDAFRELLGGFLWEEINRWKVLRPNRDAYRTMRQITVGMRPQFVLGEIAAGIELPEGVRQHTDLRTLESLTCSAIGWANDIFTCAKEFGHDHAHNIALLVMDEESLSLVDARRHIADGHDELIRMFQAIEEGLPDHLVEDRRVRLYVSMLRSWIRGHLDWARETGRYPARIEYPLHASA